jgi:alpha-tubulin suppressor-like RCC1 family protein
LKTVIKNFFYKIKFKIKKIEKQNQKIFSFGNNEYGELGGFDGENSSKLFNIEFFDDKKIKDFCCGSHSNYILLSFF